MALAVKADLSLQPHEQWWSNNPTLLQLMFHRPISKYAVNSISRKTLRNYLKKTNYHTLLDAACGPGTEYLGFVQDNLSIAYTGIDVTQKFIDAARSVGANVFYGSIEHIPYPDKQFDVGYTRHALENLPHYRSAITELIRIAQIEVLLIFFIRPRNVADDVIKINNTKYGPLYYNIYSKQKLEQFLRSNPRVNYFIWQDCDIDETILHIYLNDS
jgi:ubiquinone/menaquinone biosynthesis C-methylase UbiE